MRSAALLRVDNQIRQAEGRSACLIAGRSSLSLPYLIIDPRCCGSFVPQSALSDYRFTHTPQKLDLC
jgi:hypothetical protein